MNLKYVLVGIVILIAYMVFFQDTEGDVEEAPVVAYKHLPYAEEVKHFPIESFDIEDLFDDNIKLSDLAELDHYTIVEIYSRHCSASARLVKRVRKFLEDRTDVLLKRVKTFSGFIRFPTADGMTKEQWNARWGAIREMYPFYGTPHVEIYDPNGNLIAGDHQKHKTGLKFLKSWLTDYEI